MARDTREYYLYNGGGTNGKMADGEPDSRCGRNHSFLKTSPSAEDFVMFVRATSAKSGFLSRQNFLCDQQKCKRYSRNGIFGNILINKWLGNESRSNSMLILEGKAYRFRGMAFRRAEGQRHDATTKHMFFYLGQ